MTLVARHGALSDIGLHRKTNEDTFVIAPPLYAVCDGMGGAQAGEVASSLAAETLAAAVADGRPLLAAAEEANAAVYERASGHERFAGMGTTLTAVLLEGDGGRFVHVGDSRAYLLRGGALRQVSDDHSLVGEMVRDGRLTEEEAAVHPHRSILSRALGTEASVSIDEFEVDLLAGDALLLCSDGLSGVVGADDIGSALVADDPQEAAEELVRLARVGGGPDNITALVLRIERPGDEGRDPAASPAAASSAATPPAAVEAAADQRQADGSPEAAEAAPSAAPAPRPDGTPMLGPEGAPAPGPGEAPGPGREARRLGCLVAMLAVAVVIALAGAVILSTVYFIDVDDGRLAVYSGLPVTVGPLKLHVAYRRSARPYASLAPFEQRIVDRRSLRSRSDALALAERLGMWP